MKVRIGILLLLAMLLATGCAHVSQAAAGDDGDVPAASDEGQAAKDEADQALAEDLKPEEDAEVVPMDRISYELMRADNEVNRVMGAADQAFSQFDHFYNDPVVLKDKADEDADDTDDTESTEAEGTAEDEDAPADQADDDAQTPEDTP